MQWNPFVCLGLVALLISTMAVVEIGVQWIASGVVYVWKRWIVPPFWRRQLKEGDFAKCYWRLDKKTSRVEVIYVGKKFVDIRCSEDGFLWRVQKKWLFPA